MKKRSTNEIPHKKLTIAIVLSILFVINGYGEKNFWRFQVIETPNYVVKSILQDSVGLIWLATNDGLYRYDGSDIKPYFPIPDCPLSSNRIDRIQEHASHHILCQQRNIIIMFDRKREKFGNLPEDLQKLKDIREYKRNKAVPNDRWQEILASVECPEVDRIYMHTYDRDSNLWVGTSGGLWLITRQVSLFDHIDRKSEVVTFFRDDKHRVWVVSTDNRIQIHDATMNPLGYLSPDGRIVKDDTVFPYPVHSIKQDRRGNILMAARESGLLILQPKNDGNQFKIRQLKANATNPEYPDFDNIYEIHIDRQGTLWVGGQYDKLNIARPDSTGSYIFSNASTGLSKVQGKIPESVRSFLELKEDILLIFSENGLYCCNTRFNDYSELRFYHQTHDKTDTTSLPQNNILAVTQSHNGEVILSCGGQLCEIVGKNYLQEKVPFRKIDTPQFPASVAALCSDDKGLVWGVTNRSVFSYDPIKKIINHYPPSSPKEVRHFSVNPFFVLNDSCIMKGCREGWIQFDPRKVAKRSNLAPVYISEVKTLKTQNSIIVDTDSIISLRPEEREFSVRFSVLDYNRTSPVWYAYRMIGEDMKWSLTEQNETAPYVDLPAGKYTFAVRSTNGDGRWLDNERKLIIEIQPYWYEKTSIRWCMAILFLLSIAGGWWLIDRYAKKQTLKAMEKLRALQQEVSAPDVIPTSDTNQSSFGPETTDKNDAFSRKLLAYLDAHIGDTDLKVEDLALHLGMSRKQLLQKMKTLFNCTPIDFIIANRITRSLQYMQSNNEMNIAEIAYCSGFNDPRYFSRCFKKHTGKSPSEYLSEVKRKATKAQT